MESMAASAPGAERLREHEERVDRAIAHRMAHDLEDKGEAPPSPVAPGAQGLSASAPGAQGLSASSSGIIRDAHGVHVPGPHPRDAGVVDTIIDDPMNGEEMMLMNL